MPLLILLHTQVLVSYDKRHFGCQEMNKFQPNDLLKNTNRYNLFSSNQFSYFRYNILLQIYYFLLRRTIRLNLPMLLIKTCLYEDLNQVQYIFCNIQQRFLFYLLRHMLRHIYNTIRQRQIYLFPYQQAGAIFRNIQILFSDFHSILPMSYLLLFLIRLANLDYFPIHSKYISRYRIYK